MKTKVKSLQELSAYEEAIIHHLVLNFGYDQPTSLLILREYRPVMQLIGGYPTSLDYAMDFDSVWKRNVTGEQWVRFVQAQIKPKVRVRKRV